MRLRLTIDGMIAIHAKRAVFTALAGVRGVANADVEMGSALLECTERVPEDVLREALAPLGHQLRTMVRELPLAPEKS